MTSRARALVVSVLVPLALLACNRSEELGHLPDGAAQPVGDDASIDAACHGPLGCVGPAGPCTTSTECVTGFCVNGVCCQTACTGSCMVCNARPGECTQLSSCSEPLGTSCQVAAECASGFCVDGVCCDTACTGSCMTCTATGSAGSCVSMSGCGQPQRLGQPCTSAAGCLSGFCVGGVCCDTACDGSCMTCTAIGSLGTCVQATSCP